MRKIFLKNYLLVKWCFISRFFQKPAVRWGLFPQPYDLGLQPYAHRDDGWRGRREMEPDGIGSVVPPRDRVLLFYLHGCLGTKEPEQARIVRHFY